MVPTGLGWKAAAFYAVLFTAFFSAPYMNLFFLLLSFLSVVAVLSSWWTRRNLHGTRGRVVSIEPSAAGKSSPVAIVLDSGGSRSRFVIDCVIALERERLTCARIDVLRGEQNVTGALPPLPRGCHSVRAAWVESAYPFGFFRLRRAIPAPEHVVVYPAPADLGDARNRTDLITELCGASASAKGEMGPSGVRDYRPGDELRNVHWKATARRGDLAVREWEGTALAGIEVSLDLRAGVEDLERSLSIVAALALWAREHKEVLALGSQDHTGTYGEGHRPWNELMTYLAAARALPADGPAPPATSPGVLRLPAASTAGGAP